MVLLDVFRKPGVGDVRAVWIVTPWSEGGRYAGAVFSDERDGKTLNVWRIEGDKPNSLLHTLQSR